MNESRWQRVEDIFSRAVDMPAGRQQALVEEMCEGDESLASEVLVLLEEDRHTNSLLDSGLDHTARDLLNFGRMPALIEQQIGPYRLSKLLGEGGMGVVYLAERTDIGGQVAVKLLRDAWLSPMRRQRFRVEQLTLAQLNHPSIARIYDSGMLEDGTPWFVMEYADGLPLTEHWKKHGVTVRECLFLFRRVCEAVQYAHSHAIIHRDLKPSNILVNSAGEVKLLDFGIAKQLTPDKLDQNQTITELRLMTPAYAAPEQLNGSPVGVFSDVYALGVLLYELLTGSVPRISNPLHAEGKTISWRIEKPSSLVRREKPDKSRELSKSEWKDLDVLSLKALEPDAESRYRSVDALINDLSALVEGRPLEALGNSLRYTIGKFTRRNLRVIVSLTAMLVLVAATVIFYTIRLARARNAALQEAARTQRIQQFTESLFDGGDQSAGPATDLRAVELLDRGRHEAEGLASDPEMQAEMQETLGGIYQKLGKLDLAEPLLSAALETRSKMADGDSRKVADGLVALGLLRKDEGRLDAAERLVRQGLEMDQRILPAHDTDIARSMVALGTVWEVHGRYDQANEILEAALNLRPKNSETAETANNLMELANVQFYQGHYDVAESLNHQALAIDRKLFGEQHPDVAQELNNLGAIEMNRGNYPSSEAYYRRALAITEAWYGTDHPETAANLTALSQPLTEENRDEEAQGLLERALTIQKRVNGPVHSTVATTLNQLGLLAFKRDQYDSARTYFTQAMEIWVKLYGDQHQFVAVAYSNLGSVCLDEKDYACAEKMYREAVRRLDAASSESLSAAIAHLKLGRALLRQNRFAEAEPQTLTAYKYLSRQVSSTDTFLAASRKDLAAIYDGLRDKEKALHYRSELSAAAGNR
jgi:serine/threonine protein kinase/Tfp pilus assembly protein PilF